MFFTLTNAEKVTSMWLLVGFLACALTLYAFLTVLQRFLERYQVVAVKQGHRPVIIIACAGIVLLALSSSGELTARDAVVILPLAALFYLYASYNRRQKSEHS